jgi:rsbT antagonist protein RsbS
MRQVRTTPVPIIKQGEYLVATLKAALRDRELSTLRHVLVDRVDRSGSRGVIVDVTALDVMDSFAASTLGDLARATRQHGAEMVVVGIQPDVALAAVQLGLTFEDVPTALDLEDGLARLDEMVGRDASSPR